MVANRSVSSLRSAAVILTPLGAAIFSRTAPPMLVKGDIDVGDRQGLGVGDELLEREAHGIWRPKQTLKDGCDGGARHAIIPQ